MTANFQKEILSHTFYSVNERDPENFTLLRLSHTVPFAPQKQPESVDIRQYLLQS